MNSTKFPYSLYALIDTEIFILLIVFAVLSFLFYRFFLSQVTFERHASLQRHFRNLTGHSLTMTVLFLSYLALHNSFDVSVLIQKMTPYIASFTFFSGVIVFVKTCRLFVLQYLFLGSMRAGVPLLLVNIFSLLLSVGIGFWTISYLFNIQLTPILATSAAFSIILGLALQDTLGNLFAGISLQIDKTFEIDDWLEIQNGNVKVVGQVKELTWRSTALLGLSDEVITLPNKLISSSQISNFSPDAGPIIRSQTFRIPINEDKDKAKNILESTVSQISDVRGIPSPVAFILDVTENWFSVKIIYFIDNYGKQFSVGDKVLSKCMTALQQNGIQTARQVLEIKDHRI